MRQHGFTYIHAATGLTWASKDQIACAFAGLCDSACANLGWPTEVAFTACAASLRVEREQVELEWKARWGRIYRGILERFRQIERRCNDRDLSKSEQLSHAQLCRFELNHETPEDVKDLYTRITPTYEGDKWRFGPRPVETREFTSRARSSIGVPTFGERD